MTVYVNDPNIRALPVRIFGSRAHLVVGINDAERDRRDRAGLGALTDLATLDGLLNLPLGLPVDIAGLTDAERRLVARLPDSIVEHRALIDATVVRRVQPVLSVRAATVRARSWRAGLVNVSQFAPYCPRSLVLLCDLSEGERDDACLACCYHGVGLTVTTSNGLTSLVAPDPFPRAQRVSAARRWWLTEEVYRQLTTRSGVR